MEIEPAPLVRGPAAALERPGLHYISPATRKQDGQKCSITFFLQALAVGNLPQPLRLFSGEPIS